METLFSYVGAGVRKVRDNPQLAYTGFVAVVIVAAFVFVADRFIVIADDAQERLINVRVGSIQDAFVPFAADRMDSPEYLNAKIADIVKANETIRSFRVLKRGADGAHIVTASNDPSELGSTRDEDGFMYSLASSDPSNSMTFETSEGGERLFKTARAIPGADGVAGVVITVQTLSAADRMIQGNIAKSVYVLIAVIALILLLFLRYARVVDYMALYEKLKQVDRLKDDFISMASHELRTPLSVIRGYAEFIREAPELAPETKDFASKIDVSARDLDTLVSDILDVSRIQQGRMSYKMERLDPSKVIEAVVSGLEAPAKEKGLSLAFDRAAAGEGQAIVADEGRLRQALTNIVGNAVKYTRKGSVTVSQYAEGGEVHIRVSDTGIGISAEERERLFEKFYRIKTKETEDIRGTGLGLWITAQIVKEMKGRISVESIKSVGSHFILSFPKAD